MKKTNVYKTIFLDKKLVNIDPFYIIHKSENINQANINAKNYYISYISNKSIGSDKKNNLYKNFKVASIKLKKL